MKKNRFLFLLPALLIISACVTVHEKKAGEDMPTPHQPAAVADKLSVQEQEKMAEEALNAILEMTLEADRLTLLPKMELAYKDLIGKYPDAAMAEESYLRLLNMYLIDYNPPKVEEAEKTFAEFIHKYPGSYRKSVMEDMFARFFYSKKIWGKLLTLCTPKVREYIKTGKLETPFYLFLFSEAKFNLGDMAEAEKGFRIVKELYPRLKEGSISGRRLEEIEKIKKKKE